MLEIIILLTIGFVIGWCAALWHASGIIAAALQHKAEVADEAVTPKITKVPLFTAETHQNTLYVYRDGDFITQGATVEDIVGNLVAHRSIKHAIIVTDSENVLVLDGAIHSRKPKATS